MQTADTMGRFMNSLAGWARRTTSSFAELISEFPADAASAAALSDGATVYRLRHWPSLPQSLRTADVLRLLSLMCTRPVNRHWMQTHGGLAPRRVDQLLRHLRAQEALDEIDTAKFERPARLL